MTGKGSRFRKAGFQRPKPFIDVLGQTMIERVLDNLSCDDIKFILIAQQEHIQAEKALISKIKKDYNVEFIPINQITEGAACTTLFARQHINNSYPLVIANSDQIVDINFQDFVNDCLNRKLDGSIMTFKNTYRDTKWSFASIDEKGLVKEVAEKKAISDQATVGIYMFTEGSIYVNAAIDMIVRNERINNEFYVCPVYNFAIANNSKIGIYEIDYTKMHGLGTPKDLQAYIESVEKH